MTAGGMVPDVTPWCLMKGGGLWLHDPCNRWWAQRENGRQSVWKWIPFAL